jgi:hypothetical protein
MQATIVKDVLDQGYNGTFASLRQIRKRLALRYHPDKSDLDRKWFQELFLLTQDVDKFNNARMAAGISHVKQELKRKREPKKDKEFKNGKDGLGIVGEKELKKFCCTPVIEITRGGNRVKCGECVINGLHSNFVAFAKDAIAAHNSYRFFDEPNNSQPFDPDYIHVKVQRLQGVLEDLGLGFHAEQDEDGVYDIDEVTDDIVFDEIPIKEIMEMFKVYGISIIMKSNVSYTRGFGIKKHSKMMGHYVEMGKEE